ncbi:MAG: NAD-dependent malic enzyme, partial [Planctomycetes bacterium]|nr:NAD-dependent malic enzyme [Planctomycetota bacterium]
MNRKEAFDASSAEWAGGDGSISTEQVAQRANPTVMIGATGRANTNSKALVRPMLAFTDHPVVMPLSNPTSRAEATPTLILEWTDGRALIATGSPFEPVERNGVLHRIRPVPQRLRLPHHGPGVGSVNARRVSESMFLACA